MKVQRNLFSTGLAGVGLIAVIALAVRLAHLQSATPLYDEFYHVLAARSLLLDGSFSIGAGEYTRATLFTRLVAMSLSVFGDSLAAGRVPALLAGTLWVVAVFAWTRHVAGSAAAWGAGLLLAFDPGAIHLSQWVRFYTLHGLLIWIGAMSAYRLFSGPISLWRAALIGAAGIGAFAVALDFVQSALIAAAAAAIWAGAVSLPRLARSLKRNPTLWWPVGAGAVVALALGAWIVASGTVEAYWDAYTTPFPWQEGSTIDRRFYAWWLSGRYPTLWSLFPLAIVAAVARFPRPALFALCMFVVSFVAVSFAAGQQERYLYFAIPFFFVVWGLALASFVPALRNAGERALEAVRHLGLPARARGPAVLAGTVITVAFVVSQNDASRMAFRMVFPGDDNRPYMEANWRATLPRLRPWADSADVVVSAHLLKPLYYLGRGDVHLNGYLPDYAFDDRTGRPVISSPEALARVIECFRSGLVLLERFHLNRPNIVPKETVELLLARTTEIPIPREPRVIAYRWRHDVSADAPGCPPWQTETAVPGSHAPAGKRQDAPVD